jgi:LacI family gluconate utilization system Gnt-I transcriptional repressor
MKRLTLKDVAAKAKVSPITVSRVVNGADGVRANVRQKVEAAIAELGYIPNRSASVLASSKSKLIGVLIPSLSNVVFNDVLRGIYDIATTANYQILLFNTHYSPLEEMRAVRTLLGQSPEGIIITGGEQTATTRTMLEEARVPIVQIMGKVDKPIDINVGFSHFDAGGSVAQLLLDKRYRKIAFLGARMDRRTCQRLDGFKQRLSAVNYLDDRRIVTTSEPSSVAMGVSLFRELMEVTKGDCDAVFCCNDDLAIGVLHECKKMNISVPEEMGVCGFNDIEMAAFTEPALTTVRVNRYRMGSKAMELIFEKTHPTSENKSTISGYINTGFELVMRNSTR